MRARVLCKSSLWMILGRRLTAADPFPSPDNVQSVEMQSTRSKLNNLDVLSMFVKIAEFGTSVSASVSASLGLRTALSFRDFSADAQPVVTDAANHRALNSKRVATIIGTTLKPVSGGYEPDNLTKGKSPWHPRRQLLLYTPSCARLSRGATSDPILPLRDWRMIASCSSEGEQTSFEIITNVANAGTVEPLLISSHTPEVI